MRRFAIFITVLLVLVVIGSRPRAVSSPHRSLCVCMASKAALLMKSITSAPDTTTAQAPAQPLDSEAAATAE